MKPFSEFNRLSTFRVTNIWNYYTRDVALDQMVHSYDGFFFNDNGNEHWGDSKVYQINTFSNVINKLKSYKIQEIPQFFYFKINNNLNITSMVSTSFESLYLKTKTEYSRIMPFETIPLGDFLIIYPNLAQDISEQYLQCRLRDL